MGVLSEGMIAATPGKPAGSTRLPIWLFAVTLSAHPANALAFTYRACLPELFPFPHRSRLRGSRRPPHFDVHRDGLGYDQLAARARREVRTSGQKGTGHGQEVALPRRHDRLGGRGARLRSSVG